MGNYKFKKNTSRGGKRDGGNQGAAKMHQTSCTDCGSQCEVPFKPRPGKPVLCNKCFKNDSQPHSDRFDNKRNNNKFDKNRRGQDYGEKRMYTAICTDCDIKCEVPFKPTGEKPVLCSECFNESRGSKNSGVSQEQFDELNERFDELSEKLDKALKILNIIKPIKRVFTIGKEELEAIRSTDEENSEEKAVKKVATKKATTKASTVKKKAVTAKATKKKATKKKK